MKKAQRGFTLIELLVATVVLAVAVGGLMQSLSGSMRVANRITDRDRAAMLARRKMEELMTERRLPRHRILEGPGWRARVVPFEVPPNVAPGTPIIDRIEVEVMWTTGPGANDQRTFALEGFRRHYLRPEEFQGGVIR
jgi:general secretion pathway protein I